MLRLPLAVAALGWAGLLPALAATIAVIAGPVEWREVAAAAGASYAALILSFLGGSWWGLAAASRAAPPREAALAVAVLPSLAGWMALMLDRGAGLMLLGLLFVAVLPGDSWLARAGLAPAWWLRLRVPLSLGMASAALVMGGALSARG